MLQVRHFNSNPKPQICSPSLGCPAGKMVNIGQALGWVMTVTYLGARVPQIYKNQRRRTTEGLSLFMFVLLVIGSITYVLSIFIRYATCKCRNLYSRNAIPTLIVVLPLLLCTTGSSGGIIPVILAVAVTVIQGLSSSSGASFTSSFTSTCIRSCVLCCLQPSL